MDSDNRSHSREKTRSHSSKKTNMLSGTSGVLYVQPIETYQPSFRCNSPGHGNVSVTPGCQAVSDCEPSGAGAVPARSWDYTSGG